MASVPVYRAKKIDSDEYVVGYLKFTKYNNRTEYVINYVYDNSSVFGECEIDPSTLSVLFPETNIEDLFFGLDNGLGASIIEAVFVDDSSPFKGIAMHSHYGYVFFDKNNDWVHINKLKDIKVIGIQK